MIGTDVALVDRSGVLDVESAVYEVIWSEIINFSLPYGAIRSSAIIDLGLCFKYEGKDYPRALLVRLPAVRPAHFLRANYFKDSGSKGGAEDVARVKAAIRRIIEFLPAVKNKNESSNYELLSEGLVELAQRYAEQFAASRAKQIYHNNISASNLSIDGKWIDLSSAKIFTSLKNGDKQDILNFESEHVQAMKSIGAICYHLVKYSVINAGESQTILKRISAAFIAKYKSELYLCCNVKAGFFPKLLRQLNQGSAYLAFSNNLRKVLAYDSYSVTTLSTELGWVGYEHWGLHLYLKLLSGVTHGVSQDYTFLNVKSELISDLVSSYEQFFDQVTILAHQEGITRKSLIYGMFVNIVRLNRSSEILFNLSKSIKDLAKGDLAYTSVAYDGFIRRAVRNARLEFEDEIDFKIPFWYDEKVNIYFDALNANFNISFIGGESLCVDSLNEIALENTEILSALSFYDTVWIDFYEENI
ncbi:hypothetical protein [Pseudomonas poae]|uniref:hypothetical protein n=1 Tax=Pseudomonas poae TaxID=200451 RepID=UPI0030E222AB